MLDHVEETNDVLEESKDSVEETNENLEESNDNVEEDQVDLNAFQLELLEKLDNLDKKFENKILKSTYEQEVGDKMHAELQDYKKGMYAQLIRPILQDIGIVIQGMNSMSNEYKSKPEGEQNIPVDDFLTFADELEQILENNNVEVYSSDEGDDFVALKQRIIGKVDTDDKSKHKTVAKSISIGYAYKDQPILRENVKLYNYEENKEENENG